MRSNWTENLHNVVRNSLDAFLSQQRAPSGEDNNLTNSHSHTSHVSHPRRNRAPIPEQVPRQYLTRHMNIYIRTIDPAQNDPIQVGRVLRIRSHSLKVDSECSDAIVGAD